MKTRRSKKLVSFKTGLPGSTFSEQLVELLACKKPEHKDPESQLPPVFSQAEDRVWCCDSWHLSLFHLKNGI